MTSATKSTTPIPRSQNVQQWLRMDHTRRAGNWITVSMCTHFDGLMTKLLLKTFYDFLIHHFKKKRKKSCFLKSEKNVKTYSRTLPSPRHPRQTHNGVVCCCVQRTAYSTRVALPCIVSGDDHLSSFFGHRWPWPLTFNLDVRTRARFLYNAPNRRVSSYYV